MRRLPVTAALKHTLSLTFRHLGPALRISWAWLVVLAAATAVFIGVTNDMSQPGQVPDLAPLLLAILLVTVVIVAAMASIAVAWHRYILLEEGGDVAYNLRADGTVWRYAGNVFGLGLGFVLAVSLPSALLTAMSEYMLYLIVPAIVLLTPILYRFMVKLPAIALERKDFTFKDALAATDGNYWQLLGLIVLYTILAVILNVVITVISGVALLGGLIGAIFTAIAGVVLQWLGLIFGISLLTTLYGYFVEGREF